MKNILLFATIAGIAAAVAIYFATETEENLDADDIQDAAGNAYDTMNKNIGKVERGTREAFNAMS